MNLLKETNIVEQILLQLSKVSTIPNEGFLGGGAVANTLMNMKWGSKYPINDLDIFVESDITKEVFTPLRTNNLIVSSEYNGFVLSYDHGSNYRILDVDREGMLNWIYISKVRDRENVKEYGYILNGFDFNCCQVGIDLSNNQIYYTSEFEEFLETKQLEITAIYTPAHTAMRLFKKIKDLKCYCNIDKCMELLSQPLIYETQARLSHRHFGFYFSHKYKDMYREYYSQLKPYFKMIRFFDHKKKLWESRDKLYNSVPLEDVEHAANWLDPTRSIPQEVLDKWGSYNDIMWTLTPIKYTTPNEEISIILEHVNYNPLTFINAYNIIKGKMKKTLITKAKMIMEHGSFTKIIALIWPEFYNCDFTIDHIKIIEEEIDRNHFLQVYILKFKLNLQDSIEFCGNIHRILKKEGEWITPILNRVLDECNSIVKPTYENMVEFIKREKEKMGKPLVKPLSLSHIKLPSHITIKEIICECDLNWAGNKLKNCLNDPSQQYAEKIKEGRSRVFIIMTNKSSSAIEFHPQDHLIYKENQLLSSCNKKASLYHRIIGDILKNELNLQILKDGYEKKIKYYNDIILLNNGLLQTVGDEKTDKNEIGYNIGIGGNREMIFGVPDDDDPLIYIDEEEGDIDLDEVFIPGFEEDTPTTIPTLGDLDALRELRDQLENQSTNDPPPDEEETSRDIDTLFT